MTVKLYTKEIRGCGECPNSSRDAYGLMCGIADRDEILDLSKKPVPDWCPLPDKVETMSLGDSLRKPLDLTGNNYTKGDL